MNYSSLTGSEMTPRTGRRGPGVTTKARPRQPPVYPIFEEAAEFVTDVYWVNKLQAAARNKFPPRVFPRGDSLVYSTKNAEFQLELSREPAQLARDFVQFLQKHLNLRSDRDIEFARLNAELHIDEQPVLAWKNIDKKTRALLLKQYGQGVSSRLELTPDQTQQLQNVLNLGLYLNIFNTTNIHYEDGKVISVEQLGYDPDRKHFFLPPEALSKCALKAARAIDKGADRRRLASKHEMFLPKGGPVTKPLMEYLHKCGTKNVLLTVDKDKRAPAARPSALLDFEIAD